MILSYTPLLCDTVAMSAPVAIMPAAVRRRREVRNRTQEGGRSVRFRVGSENAA